MYGADIDSSICEGQNGLYVVSSEVWRVFRLGLSVHYQCSFGRQANICPRTLSDSAMDLVGTSVEKDGAEVSPRGSPCRIQLAFILIPWSWCPYPKIRTGARTRHGCGFVESKVKRKGRRSGRIEKAGEAARERAGVTWMLETGICFTLGRTCPRPHLISYNSMTGVAPGSSSSSALVRANPRIRIHPYNIT